jgi:hypothetical protein
MEERKIEVLDLDKIIPPSRIFKLTEKVPLKALNKFWRIVWKILGIFGIKKPLIVREIDVAKTTTRASIEMDRFLDEYQKAATAMEIETINDRMYDIMITACKPSFPEITLEWLQDNTTPEQVLELFKFVLQPYVDRALKIEAQAKNWITQGVKDEAKK